MEYINYSVRYLNILADLLTIASAAIAIWILIFKADKLSSLFSILINYSYQLTLTDLQEQLTKLDHLDANDHHNHQEVSGILHELKGQVNNDYGLKNNFKNQLIELNKYTRPKTLPITNDKKREFVKGFRQAIKNAGVENFKRSQNEQNN